MQAWRDHALSTHAKVKLALEGGLPRKHGGISYILRLTDLHQECKQLQSLVKVETYNEGGFSRTDDVAAGQRNYSVHSPSVWKEHHKVYPYSLWCSSQTEGEWTLHRT